MYLYWLVESQGNGYFVRGCWDTLGSALLRTTLRTLMYLHHHLHPSPTTLYTHFISGESEKQTF